MSITGKRTDRKHMSIQDMLTSAARHQDFSILFAVRQGEPACGIAAEEEVIL